MKSNITLIALNAKFKKEIAKKLAEKLGMFYVDVNEMIKYDLLNINQVISVAGIDYYNKVESKTVASISTFENALITVENDTFFNNDNYKILKEKSLFIYLRLDFESFKKQLDKEMNARQKDEKEINEKLFYERDKIMSGVSDIAIDISLSNKNKIASIIKEIKKHYREVIWKH